DDAVDLVGAEHHQVAGVGPVKGQAGRLQLVEHDLEAAAAGPVVGGGPGPGRDQFGDLARLAAAQVAVLADDQGVEVPGRDLAELTDVLVAAVAGAGDDPGAAAGHDVAALGRAGQPVHEVAEHAHAGGVVAVVDDHPVAVHLEQVEPPRGHLVGGGERAQPGPDGVDVGAGGQGGGGRGHGVGHVHAGPAAEARRHRLGGGD